MKNAQKLMVVPYNYLYETPLKQYITNLDNEMSNILNENIPIDQKMKLYNNILIKYKENYDPDVLEDNNQLKTINNLIAEVKQENKEIDDEIKDQYNNLNIKLEKISEVEKVKKEKNIKKKTKESLNKSIKIAKTILTNKEKENEPKRKLQAKRRIKNDNNISLPHKKNKLNEIVPEKNDSIMEIQDNDDDDKLNTAMNKTNPLQTRAAALEYNTAKMKSTLDQGGTGLVKFKWCKLKYL